MKRSAFSLLALLLAGTALHAQVSSGGFVENRGQWDEEVRYRLEQPGLTLWITDRGAVYDLCEEPAGSSSSHLGTLTMPYSAGIDPLLSSQQVRGHVLRAEFVGASEQAEAIGVAERGGRVNYFLGDDPARWGRNCRIYSSVRLSGIYDGIDAVFYLDAGRPRYDIVAAPGADLSRVRIAMSGADELSLPVGGRLTIGTSVGAMEMRDLIVYQRNERGEKCQITSRFLLEDGLVGFALGAYDRTKPIVVDPLIYSTLLSTGRDETGVDVVVDAEGNAIVTGYVKGTSGQSGFPTTTGAYSTRQSGEDMVITKLDPSGSSLIFSTYLGGEFSDAPSGIVLDAHGSIYVIGSTLRLVAGGAYPTTENAFDSTYGGEGDIVVTKLDPTGSQLEYSTLIGGAGADVANAIVVDAEGNAYLTGTTRYEEDLEETFPVTPGAFQTALAGNSDAFVAKLDPTGSTLLYSTIIGGLGSDQVTDIAIDAEGSAYITGWTETPGTVEGYPTTEGAFDRERKGGTDVFVTKLSPDGSSLTYSTLIGAPRVDVAYGIAVDETGSAYITGSTHNSSNEVDYPRTPGAYVKDTGTGYDLFVTKLSPDGSSLLYSAVFGAQSEDRAYDIAIDGLGAAYVVGATGDTEAKKNAFPTTNDAVTTTYVGDRDAFALKLDPTGSILEYSTLLGGDSHDEAAAVALDADGGIYVTGFTAPMGWSTVLYPLTEGAYDTTTRRGGDDIFVTKLSIGLSAREDGDRVVPFWMDLR